MRTMGRKSKYKPEVTGPISFLTRKDEEELRDTIQYENEKAQEWRNKFETLYRKVYIENCKEQLNLF